VEQTAEKSRDPKSQPSSTRPKPPKIVEKHEHIQGRGIISSLSLGLTDGVITNVAFLAGFAGAVNNLSFIQFAGIAAMIAGSVSMFFGGLNASRSEQDLFKADLTREASEIELEPEEERLELMNFYMQKGLTKEESEIVVRRVTTNKEKWLEDILMHELHIHEEKLENPLKIAGVIGLAFFIGALVPLLCYFIVPNRFNSILISVATSLIFLFVVGGWKGHLSSRKFWRAGTEMFLIGAAASALLYLIGSLLVFV